MVRRSRTEELRLVVDGKPSIKLFDELRDRGQITTQDIFQVSPDGAYLAYSYGDALHVRAGDGSERTIHDYKRFALMRFSPDSAYLAVVLGDSGSHRIALYDLRTGETRELASYYAVAQLEWMHDAVVALAYDSERQRQVLVELPLTGEPATLLDDAPQTIDRFVAAATGTRIVAFVRDSKTVTHVLAFDAATPTDTHELAALHSSITNAAASRDGARVAFTTADAVFLATGSERAEAISARSYVHSLWFAADGRLGYASADSATILDGKHARRFDTVGQIAMLRFDPTSARALVATPHRAWDAATTQRLTAVDPGTELLGVDHFAGGLVLWTTESDDM
jgi:hypothetical protein